MKIKQKQKKNWDSKKYIKKKQKWKKKDNE